MDILFGLIIILILGVFAISAAIVSSECNKYDGFHRKSDDDHEQD